MKRLSLILASLLLLVVITHAIELKSPSGNFKMNFSIENDGRPTYQLFYKNTEIIKPRYLDLELIGGEKIEFNTEIKEQEVSTAYLYNGLSISDVEYSTFDETWEAVWGETK